MTATTTARDAARALADAVLYEGYVLYPYRATSPKNQIRWQWGVLMPEDVVARDSSERSGNRTDVVLDGRHAHLHLTVRFLQVQRRTVEDAAGRSVDRLDAGDTTYLCWDEARQHDVDLDVDPADGLDTVVEIPGGVEHEVLPGSVGRLVRERLPLRVGVRAEVVQPTGPYVVTLVRIRVTNLTAPGDGATRPEWLRRALVACHLLLETTDAAIISQLDPPQWAAGFVAGCAHEGVFPVLAGPPGQHRVALSSPIILYDHAELAPESETAFFDALEVDELLSLRTATLSDQERREVRGTDPRAARVLGDVDAMPPELWDRLHGTVRYLEQMSGGGTDEPGSGELPPLETPWWDPGADTSVDPEQDTVRIGAVEVGRGTRVILRPGVRRADAHDLFLAGRIATVAAVLFDVDQGTHLAVTVDDDPGSDLKRAHGRYLYFAPDEVEPLRGGPP